MSNAIELLRQASRILEELKCEGGILSLTEREITEEIRAFLAADPEEEYDWYGVRPLTHRKAKGIIKDNGYHVTGFVLSRPDGDKCIVDMSAVRWLSGKEFFEIMHPIETSPPVFIQPDHLQKARISPFLCRVEPTQRDDFVPLYTRPDPLSKR